MQKIIILFVTIVFISGVKNKAFAQTTLQGYASLTLIAPNSIQKTADLNFGNIAVSANGGTVVITPGSSRSASGGVYLPPVTGSYNAASFLVKGLVSATYSITLPSTYIISSGSNTMTVNAFTSTPSGSGTLSSNGDQTIYVGATLNVKSFQPAGTYTNATGYNVTINFL